MNSSLIRNFSKEEVEIALKQMAPLKAPGLDSMPPLFFQHYWESIGVDVAKAVVSCLNSTSIESGLNHTFISLISKVKALNMLLNFAPLPCVIFFINWFLKCWQIG